MPFLLAFVMRSLWPSLRIPQVPTLPHSAGDLPHTFHYYNATTLAIHAVEPRSGPVRAHCDGHVVWSVR